MNAIMERWIQGCRREILDRTLPWSQTHLLQALQRYEEHYNAHRPRRLTCADRVVGTHRVEPPHQRPL